MVLDDDNNQIRIELVRRKPVNTRIGHDENRTANQIYLFDSN